MFRKSIFDAIDGLRRSWRGELEVTEAIQRFIDTGLTVHSHVVSGWWKDTGKPEAAGRTGAKRDHENPPKGGIRDLVEDFKGSGADAAVGLSLPPRTGITMGFL